MTAETEKRWLDGRALLFAEVPEDGEVSDISDGLFLFIPNVQREAQTLWINTPGGTELPEIVLEEG